MVSESSLGLVGKRCAVAVSFKTDVRFSRFSGYMQTSGFIELIVVASVKCSHPLTVTRLP